MNDLVYFANDGTGMSKDDVIDWRKYRKLSSCNTDASIDCLTGGIDEFLDHYFSYEIIDLFDEKSERMNFYIVKYTGPFGFIKPWTAVRDGETFSQQFLTPSIIEGLEKKLFTEYLPAKGIQGAIAGHRLNYTGISRQQEQTWSKAWTMVKSGELYEVERHIEKKGKTQVKKEKVTPYSYRPATAILNRGVLLEPHLFLAFSSEVLAQRAVTQHICLCRNEDVLFPEPEISRVSTDEWTSEDFPGFELVSAIEGETAFRVGYNRFDGGQPMYGKVISYGDPIRKRNLWL